MAAKSNDITNLKYHRQRSRTLRRIDTNLLLFPIAFCTRTFSLGTFYSSRWCCRSLVFFLLRQNTANEKRAAYAIVHNAFMVFYTCITGIGNCKIGREWMLKERKKNSFSATEKKQFSFFAKAYKWARVVSRKKKRRNVLHNMCELSILVWCWRCVCALIPLFSLSLAISVSRCLRLCLFCWIRFCSEVNFFLAFSTVFLICSLLLSCFLAWNILTSTDYKM